MKQIFDKSHNWCFFDGVAQGVPTQGKVRGILYYADSTWTKFPAGLGHCTNNGVEMLPLKITL